MRSLRAPGPRGTRIDLHLHSRASTDTGSWFLSRAVLPESFTDPAQAYALAKRRGMDLVTLTDHNTISGALEIAHHPDVIVGVEITTLFPGDRVPLHVLAWGVDEPLWADLDRARADVLDLVELLGARRIPFALAHPLHRVGGELTSDHIERCLLLFPVWEGRNGSRPAATNEIACRIAAAARRDLLERLADKHGIAPRALGPPALTGGSDDHGGFDVAGTWTLTPAAADPAELLDHLRAGRVSPEGAHGGATTLAHSVGSLAATGWLERSPAVPAAVRGLMGELLRRPLPGRPADGPAVRAPAAGLAEEVLRAVRADRRLVRRYRRLGRGPDVPARAHARLRLATGWLHRELVRRAVAPHGGGLGRRAEALAGAGALALPHLLAAGYVRAEERYAAGVERDFFGPADAAPEGAPPVVMLTDTYVELNGVAGTMRRLADYASAHPACGMRVLSCGAGTPSTPGHLDLPPVADLPVPAYGDGSWRLGVPSVLDLLDVVTGSGARVVHAATPGPMGLAGLMVARTLGLPFVATHHTELARYVLELTGDRLAAGIADRSVRWFHGQAERVYAPTLTTTQGLVRAGVDPERVVLFTRGVDVEAFSPERAGRSMRRRLGGREDVTVVLYVGRLSREKGVLRLAEAFRRAAALRPGLRLAVVGDGPARGELGRALAGTPHRFLGALRGAELAAAYASADLFCLPSATETFGQVVVEAGASGLPVVVADRGGAAELVAHGRSGLVVDADDAGALAAALALLHDDPSLRARLGATGRRMAAARPSWDEVFDELLAGYPSLLAGPAAGAPARRGRATA